MKEEQDDLTLVYMFGFKNGRNSTKDEINRLRAALNIIAGGNGLQMTWYSTAPMPLERYKENHYEMMQIARAALEWEKDND